LKFFAGYDLTRPFQQSDQQFERLTLQFNLAPLLEQFARVAVELENRKAYQAAASGGSIHRRAWWHTKYNTIARLVPQLANVRF
jgi:hypothetical protein